MIIHRRWAIYLALGLLFGVVDWYFLDLLAATFTRIGDYESLVDVAIFRLLLIAVVVGLNYGIWLVPVIPRAIYEVKRSNSIGKAALAAVVVWVAAILSYYAYYTFLLMFVGLPHLEFMLLSNRQPAGYWADFWPPFRRVIVTQVIDWIGIAVVGGAIAGAATATVYTVTRRLPFLSVRRLRSAL